MLKSFLEFNSQAQYEPIQSFYLQDDLNRKVWKDDNQMFDDLRYELMEIAYDYLDFLDIDVKLDDVILTGSLANYNWSDYSDFDVHLVFDFSKVDDNEKLVKKYLDASEKVWKLQHDLKIKGFPVELYCQDSKAIHTSTGIYSLYGDKWVLKPEKKDFKPDEDLIKIKAGKFIESVKELQADLDSDTNSKDILERFKKLWKKIKDFRQAGLEKEGEFSVENLVFKLLRRNGYIQKLLDIKKNAYDKQFK